MKPKKIVVFDLDETLGHFGQLSMLWFNLQDETNVKLTEPDFYRLMDLYPEVLRPNILNVLKYLDEKKESGECSRVLIYTNNNGEKKWPLMIKRYLEYKIGNRLFDRTIAAYRARGHQIEPLRTTHDKTYNDLMRCGRLPQQCEICFVDDLVHPKMQRGNVFYINIPKYQHEYHPREMVARFLASRMGDDLILDKKRFYNEMTRNLGRNGPKFQSENANIRNGQALELYIKQFISH
jgi:hypothetical protein